MGCGNCPSAVQVAKAELLFEECIKGRKQDQHIANTAVDQARLVLEWCTQMVIASGGAIVISQHDTAEAADRELKRITYPDGTVKFTTIERVNK